MLRPTALVLIDLQNDFFSIGSNRIGSYEKTFCVPGVLSVARVARANGWKVIHVLTEHNGRETLPRHLRRRGLEPYCLKGTAGASIIQVPDLYREGETVVRKRLFNGFHDTELKMALVG